MPTAPKTRSDGAFAAPQPRAKNTYRLASATRRSGARIVDLAVMALVAIGIGTAFMYDSLYADNSANFYDVIRNLFVRDQRSAEYLAATTVETWRMCSFAAVTFFAYCLYFIAVPSLVRGFTLGSWIFFIRTAEMKSRALFPLHLALRDLFFWVIPVFAGFCLVLANAGGSRMSLGAIFSAFSFSVQDVSTPVSIAFKAIYSVNVAVELALIVYMVARSRKLALHDIYTKTAVIIPREYLPPEARRPAATQPVGRELRLPGTVNPDRVEA